MSNAELHLVLGAGQVGPLVAERLVALGHRVRIARRTASPSRVAGVETVSIDVRDASSVARAAEGASVVYNCVNPLYDEWAEKLLPMTRGIVDGAAMAGARLVVLDNLYMYGDNSHMTEESPVAPVSKKGALRAKAAEIMLEADAKGAARVAIGRAADFFGANAPNALLGNRFLERALDGKTAQMFGDPDQLHSYSYIPDVAAGLVALGSREATRGVWMLPVLPAESTRAVVARFSRAIGRDIGVSTLPVWLLRAVGVFYPMAREVAEMSYQWQQPYVLDDARFRASFGFGATPWDRAIADTVAWAESVHRAGAREPSSAARPPLQPSAR
jgi:nucleoside-diphosphate-sugar epimerase